MSVYSANRLNSIKESKTSAYFAEVEEAFSAETFEEASGISPMGFLIQLHENDMRMFDAAITTDFKVVSESAVLEGAQLEALKEEVEKATSTGIWDKIKKALTAIKDAIIALGRKILDKVNELIKADAKIVSTYGTVIDKADDGVTVKLNIAQPISFAKLDEISGGKMAISQIASTAKDAVAKVQKGEDIEERVNTIKSFAAKADSEIKQIFQDKKETELKKGDAKASLEDLKTGKAAAASIKKLTNDAVAAIKGLESAVKGMKKDKSEEAAKVYKLVSEVGKSTIKTMNAYSRAVAQKLAADRKIVLSFGFKARKGVQEAADVTEPAIFAIGEASDLYVEQMMELV